MVRQVWIRDYLLFHLSLFPKGKLSTMQEMHIIPFQCNNISHKFDLHEANTVNKANIFCVSFFKKSDECNSWAYLSFLHFITFSVG